MTLKCKSRAVLDDLDEAAESAAKVSAEQFWPQVLLTLRRNLA
jgi:hypothetical protein